MCLPDMCVPLQFNFAAHFAENVDPSHEAFFTFLCVLPAFL